jgi:hypothetical protein
VTRSLEYGAIDDVVTQGMARSALAWLTAVEGADAVTVRRHMSEALAVLEPTELVMDLALAYLACVEVARLLGDRPVNMAGKLRRPPRTPSPRSRHRRAHPL